MATVVNGSFASPAADAKYLPGGHGSGDGLLSQLLSGVSGWSVALAVLLTLVAYDQCE